MKFAILNPSLFESLVLANSTGKNSVKEILDRKSILKDNPHLEDVLNGSKFHPVYTGFADYFKKIHPQSEE